MHRTHHKYILYALSRQTGHTVRAASINKEIHRIADQNRDTATQWINAHSDSYA